MQNFELPIFTGSINHDHSMHNAFVRIQQHKILHSILITSLLSQRKT